MTAISVETRGAVAVVRVEGSLILGNQKEFQRCVMDVIERGVGHVVVDLAAAGYVDSTGLGTLVMLAKRLRARGGALRVANLNEDLRLLFAFTRLDTVLELEPAAPNAA